MGIEWGIQSVKTLAIVIPYFNGASDLLALLQSIELSFNVNLEAFKIFVVDNNSLEEELEPIEEVGLPYVEILKSSVNGGFASAVNRGVACARSEEFEHYLILNSDTVLHNGCLQSLCMASDQYGPRAIISPLIKRFDGTVWFAGGVLSFLRLNSRHKTASLDGPSETQVISGCAVLISGQAWLEVGDWDASYFMYYEDVDFSIRARRAGFRLLVIPDAVVFHKVGGTPGNNPELYAYYGTRNRIRVFGHYGASWVGMAYLTIYLWAKSWAQGSRRGHAIRKGLRDA